MKTILLAIYTLIMTTFSLLAQNENIAFHRDLSQDDCCGDIQLYNPQKSLMTDTIYCERWDNLTNEFKAYSRTVNIYDANGFLNESLSGYFDTNSEFVYTYKKEYTYNSFDSIKTYTYFYWNQNLNNGSWDNNQKIEYTYDINHRLSYEMIFYSSSGSTEWQNNSKKYYTYLQNGDINEINTQYWNAELNQWWDYLRYRFIYDQNNKLIEKYIDYANNAEGDWSYSSRYLYTYNKCQTIEIHQTYLGPKWMNNSKKTYTENKQDLSSELLKEYWNYNEMQWDTLFKERDIYEYNTMGFIVDHIYQSMYLDWFNVSREMIEYDKIGNLLGESHFEWNHNKQYWDEIQRCSVVTSSNILDIYSTDHIDFKMFPNPTDGVLNIELEDIMSEDIKIFLINSSGQMMQELSQRSTNDRFTFDLSKYSYGTYFIDVQVDGITRVIKKVVYQ